MKTTEVFIAGGMPSVTYNPRTELGLENKLQDYLNTRPLVSGEKFSDKGLIIKHQ